MIMIILCSKNINYSLIKCLRASNIRSHYAHIHKNNFFKNFNAKTNSFKFLKPFVKHSVAITSGTLCASYLFWFRCNTSKCDSKIPDDNDESETKSEIDKIYESVKEARLVREEINWKKLWHFLKPDTLYLVIAVASSLLVAFLNVQIPISLGAIMNVLSRFANEGNSIWTNEFFTDIKWPAFKVIQLYVLQSLFTFIYISSLSIVGEKLASRLRQQLFNSFIQLDVTFFDSQRSGEIISRITADVQDFKSSFKLCISQGLRNVTQLVGCVVSLFIISPKMTLMMGTVLPCMFGVGTVFGSLLRQKSKEAQSQVAKATGIATESISNIRTVKALAMEDILTRIYNREILHAEILNVNLGIGIGIFQGLSNFALNGIVLSTLIFGGYLLSNDEMTPGSLMSFLVSTQTIQRSMAQLSLLFGSYVRGVSAGSRIFSYLELKPQIKSEVGIKVKKEKLFGDVQFKDVKFYYKSRPEQMILNDFNLKLLPGKVTALCGLSGAGKSTIALLLERLYDVSDGSITIDNYNIKDLDLNWLRKDIIGFISQEPILFATSIKENIRFGKFDATDQEIFKAAEIANADSFIRTFPNGYDTVVGERGVTISGGQKQRIAIARAIIKNPAILILDEATSALDAESEAQVQEALEKAMKGRTVLVIAHRLSTIQDADVIAVIANGKVIELGSHNSLKKLKGKYWHLIKQQSDGREQTQE